MRRLTALAALLLVSAAPAPTSTTRGVYSEAQASEGAALYQAACAMCHGDTLAGSFDVPALQGRFIAHWSDSSLDALVDYVGRAMPLYAPGSLSQADNTKIVAYLLKANGMPAGPTPLPADRAALKTIRFDPIRPRPAP